MSSSARTGASICEIGGTPCWKPLRRTSWHVQWIWPRRRTTRSIRKGHLSTGPRAELEQRIEAGRRARERLVESNLRLVVSIAGRYAGRGLSLQDLIQEGNIGLQVGIDKYEWRKGFAPRVPYHCVLQWIRQASRGSSLANGSIFLRLPVSRRRLLRRALAPGTALAGGGFRSTARIPKFRSRARYPARAAARPFASRPPQRRTRRPHPLRRHRRRTRGESFPIDRVATHAISR